MTPGVHFAPELRGTRRLIMIFFKTSRNADNNANPAGRDGKLKARVLRYADANPPIQAVRVWSRIVVLLIVRFPFLTRPCREFEDAHRWLEGRGWTKAPDFEEAMTLRRQ